MSAITTRDIAAAAAVNEVTVFRHFGDKASLAREAVRRFSPASELDEYQPGIDASSPQAAIDGLLRLPGRTASPARRPPGTAAVRPRRCGPLPRPHRRPEGNPGRRPPPADQSLRASPRPAPRRRQHRRRGHRLPRHAPHARDLAVPALDRPQRRTGHRPARRAATPPVPQPRRPTQDTTCPVTPTGTALSTSDASAPIPSRAGQLAAALRNRLRCIQSRPRLTGGFPAQNELSHEPEPPKQPDLGLST